MPVFGRTTNSEVLISIEYAKILASTGQATESILHALARQRFGSVTTTARRVLEQLTAGEPLEKAFPTATLGIEHPNLNAFFLILRSETTGNITRRMTELSDRIVKQMELTTDSLIDRMKNNLNRVMIALTFPLTIFFVALIQDALAIPDQPLAFALPPYINEAIIAAALAVLAVIFYLLRYRD